MEIRKMCMEDIRLIMQADGDMTDSFQEYLRNQLRNQDEKKECPTNAKCANDDELTLCLLKEVRYVKLRKINGGTDSIEVIFGVPDDIEMWMDLVNSVRWNFPGLETKEAMEEQFWMGRFQTMKLNAW